MLVCLEGCRTMGVLSQTSELLGFSGPVSTVPKLPRLILESTPDPSLTWSGLVITTIHKFFKI
jgi:hypothetical protein